jgi:protein tyrosine phosphatase
MDYINWNFVMQNTPEDQVIVTLEELDKKVNTRTCTIDDIVVRLDLILEELKQI